MYVATGDEFYQEAYTAASSVREHMPDVEIAIATNVPETDPLFDHVIPIEDPNYDFTDRIRYYQETPFDRTLFLDTDTYLFGSVQEIFDVLDSHDLAVAHALGRRQELIHSDKDLPTIDVPDCYPMFNCGVIGATAEVVEALFPSWLELYQEHLEQSPYMSDQSAFRELVYSSDFRVATIPPEYNCRIPFCGYVKQKVKILHGSLENPEEIGAALNSPDTGSIWDSVKVNDRMDVVVNPSFERRLAHLRLRIEEEGLPATAWYVTKWTGKKLQDTFK